MKYNVHDYIIDAITLEGDSIIFSFPEGFHVANENGQELEPQRKKLVMTVDRTNWVNGGKWPLESFISVRMSRNGQTWKKVPFKKLSGLLRKSVLIVWNEYEGYWSQKMLQMRSRSGIDVEMFIENIESVDYLC